jgi:plasmid stabilization system protein ParE
MTSVRELMPTHGAVAACLALGLPRGSPARHLASQRRLAFVGPRQARRTRPRPPMALDVSPRYPHALNPPGLRLWPLPRYPYLVFYIEQDDHIAVWRVLHGQRDIPAWMHQPDEL